MADRSFLRLVLLTLGVTYVLILLGGVVSVADAGMGCGPDWPLCDGRLLPVHDRDMLLEWSHRLVAAILGLLVLAVWIQALRTQRQHRAVLAAASTLLVLVVIQSLLGALTVRHHLPPSVSTLHLATAMVFFITLTILTYWIHPIRERIHGRGSADGAGLLPALGAAAALLTFGTIVAGAYMRHIGAGLACPDWPLCHGELLPLAAGLDVWVHLVHRFAAGITALAVLAFYLVSGRAGDALPFSRFVARTALALVLLQILLGGATVVFHVALLPATVHLAVGTLLLGLLVLAPLVYADESQPLAAPAREVVP